MKYIEGKIKKIIYFNEENGYLVALFKVQKSSIIDLENQSITITGMLNIVDTNIEYHVEGDYVSQSKYGMQFQIESATYKLPSSEDEIIAFLQSPFVKGCGKTLAKNIVKLYGTKTINKIKEDYNNLLKVKSMKAYNAMQIYHSIVEYELIEKSADSLKKLGFTYEEISKIVNKKSSFLEEILNGNLYILKDLFDFKKIDDLYIKNFDKNSKLRIKECLLNSMMQISQNEGSTYYDKETIFKALTVLFNINISSEEFDDILTELINDNEAVKEDNKYYLKKYYDEEIYVAKRLYKISENKKKKITAFDEKILSLEEEQNITYNEEQKKAIKNSLNSNVSIISGGPGTGKTTIIDAICKIYISDNNLSSDEVNTNIALLAPTGRAAKKMSNSTGISAYTIHRYLGWHKDSDLFEYNEDNRHSHKLIIIDESSMLDISLIYNLLCALYNNVKIIFVGDIYQLPSVGPGLVLQDLINSDYFNFVMLNMIYRQSDNSYIPFLAKDIKNQNIDDEYMYKRDDYSFIVSSEDKIPNNIVSACKIALEKGINEDAMQVLSPMYKGDCGIDNLNKLLQKVYNREDLPQVKYGDKVYKENDKVLQLINDNEKNVFNGDIGRIERVFTNSEKKINIKINFDGHVVTYEKKDLKNITHAYAISVHKSQGSEFSHVIMPLCSKFYLMLYNKLLYTAISRAKTSLTLVGDPRSFVTAVMNNKTSDRKTTLIHRLDSNFNA